MFEALGESLPPASAWREWIAAADRTTRARVAQGEETSIVNLLLFGTSFTNEPRITSRQLDHKQIGHAVTARFIDFERALAMVVGRGSVAHYRNVVRTNGSCSRAKRWEKAPRSGPVCCPCSSGRSKKMARMRASFRAQRR